MSLPTKLGRILFRRKERSPKSTALLLWLRTDPASSLLGMLLLTRVLLMSVLLVGGVSDGEESWWRGFRAILCRWLAMYWEVKPMPEVIDGCSEERQRKEIPLLLTLSKDGGTSSSLK